MLHWTLKIHGPLPDLADLSERSFPAKDYFLLSPLHLGETMRLVWADARTANVKWAFSSLKGCGCAPVLSLPDLRTWVSITIIQKEFLCKMI